jgi:hypothetical protein
MPRPLRVWVMSPIGFGRYRERDQPIDASRQTMGVPFMTSTSSLATSEVESQLPQYR